MLGRSPRDLARVFLLVTDLGFITYWVATLGHLMPEAWLFRDYGDPTMSAWNLSFLPLDLLVSASGLGSIALARACPGSARALRLASLVATSISGLQAIAFWGLRHDFDLAWWAPNVFLLVWPLPFLASAVYDAPAPQGELAR